MVASKGGGWTFSHAATRKKKRRAEREGQPDKRRSSPTNRVEGAKSRPARRTRSEMLADGLEGRDTRTKDSFLQQKSRKGVTLAGGYVFANGELKRT